MAAKDRYGCIRQLERHCDESDLYYIDEAMNDGNIIQRTSSISPIEMNENTINGSINLPKLERERGPSVMQDGDGVSGTISSSISLLQNNSKNHVKTMGTWYFDKRERKRKYVSLTGAVFSGSEAMKHAKQDEMSEKNPMRSLRCEMKYLICESNEYILYSIANDCPKPSTFASLSKLCPLQTWGLPDPLLQRYKHLKVESLFPWQVECLTIGGGSVLLGDKNLIYSAPTSGGKTLVSEILMLRKLSNFMFSHVAEEELRPSVHASVESKSRKSRHTIFFVVPFVALAEEKASYFQDIWQDLNIGVKSFHGGGSDLTGNMLGEDVEVAVCTIERANILLTQLLDERREDQLKMVVIDEIHMLADSQRGFLLEVMLSKIRYSLPHQVQIVGMSATLPNIADLATWLDATLYTTEYRPVDLKVRICLGKQLYDVKLSDSQRENDQENASDSIIYSLTSTLLCENDDPDGLKHLVLETVAINKSAMLFCNSKRRCEVCASSVADAIEKALHKAVVAENSSFDSSNKIQNESFGKVGSFVISASIRKGRLALLENLAQTQVGLCPILRQTVPYGVAYHHAGLTLDERRILEAAFKVGYIQVLCTTSTLSAGVNLPAHRVVIRSPHMGDKYLSVAAFRQMCGRAGRKGLDTEGEAILMISGNKAEKSIAERLVTADVDPLRSHLHVGAGGGLEKLLLEMISCGRLTNESSVLKFVDCTLMKVQHAHEDVVKYTKEALLFLKKEQFVQVLTEGKLSPTSLGIATTVSGIAPRDAVFIVRPLMDARKKLILKGGLHPVYLVTPPSTTIEPDWKNYEKMLHVLYQEHPDARAVANYLGIEEGKLCGYSFNPPNKKSESAEVSTYRRFFSAILLFAMIQEWPISSIAKFTTAITRGQIQQLQKDAAVYCGMIVVFCRKLNWSPLAAALEDFSGRLNYGVQKDIIPLVRLGTEVTPARGRLLFKHGILSAQDILFAGATTITDILMESLPYDGKDPLIAAELGLEPLKDSHVEVDNKEKMKMVCERLARKIILRAQEFLKAEVARLKICQII